MVTRLLKKWLIPVHWDMMTFHCTLSIFPRNSFVIIEIDTSCLASRASHGVAMSISTVVISNLTHVWYPYLLSHMQCIIIFNRVISRVGKILLDVWPRASHLISCIARCRWIIFLFHSALQDIKWLESHYIVGVRTSSTETVDISIGTDLEWYCVVISLTSIVFILSLKTITVVFLVVLLSPMSLLFFCHEYYYYH